MIYTASFFTHELYPGRKYSIANQQPPKFKDNPFPTIKALQPGSIVAKLKAKQINEDRYTELYRQQLVREQDLLQRMFTSSQGPDGPIVLLCWEKEGNFCHRRILAEYFIKELGVNEDLIQIH